MTTYNCKHSGDQYSITKFNRHGEVESSYLCDHIQCQCPAGVRDTCRHRLMLPTFLEHSLVNTNLFLDWDNGKRIVDFNGLPAAIPNITATEIDERMAEPKPMPGDALLEALVDQVYDATVQSNVDGLQVLQDFQDLEAALTAQDVLAPQAHTDTEAQTLELYGTSPALTALGGNWRDIIRAAPEIETTEVKPANPNGWRRW